MNTVIDYTIQALIIGIPVGAIFGIIFGFKALLDWGWKEGILWYLGCQIFSPIFLGSFIFILMGFFSIFLPDLILY